MNIKFKGMKRAITVNAAMIAFFLLFSCLPKPAQRVKEEPPVKPMKESSSIFFEEAENAFERGNYEVALMKYQIYLDQNPMGEKARDSLYRMADIYFKTHRYRDALVLFVKVKNEYPAHPEAFKVKYDIIKTQYELGYFQSSKLGALQWLEEYSHNPLKGEILLVLGKNSIALNDKSKAFTWILNGLENLEDCAACSKEADNLIHGLIEDGKIEDLKMMAEYPSDNIYRPYIYHRMATCYLDDNNPDEARKAAMELVRLTTEQEWIDRARLIFDTISAQYEEKNLVIGCLLSLSGPFEIYGKETLNGIQLGMDLFEEEDGLKLELVILDTQGKAEVAAEGVEDLANNHDVIAIVGPLASKPAEAAAEKAQELGIPIITLTQKIGITSTGDMVFRNFLTPSKEVDTLLHEAVYMMGLRNFGILYPDNSYGNFFMNLFRDKVEDMGCSITAVESYNPDETDFGSQIKKMSGSSYPREKNMGSIVDFDAVFIPDSYQQIALIAPQFPFHNIYNVPFLGTSLWHSQELIETTGDYIQGAIFPTGFFLEGDNMILEDFVEKYRDNFGLEPGVLAANGYDTIRFIKKVLSTQSRWSRREFQQGFFQSEIIGVTGKISFDIHGEVEKRPVLLSVSDQCFRAVSDPKYGYIY
ncbi:MAG: penicillin-binding protein activator [Deltaproteobacteria bacterium]|nr:penicillin-binding protein activator [Deltaproteobacteria bacterium]